MARGFGVVVLHFLRVKAAEGVNRARNGALHRVGIVVNVGGNGEILRRVVIAGRIFALFGLRRVAYLHINIKGGKALVGEYIVIGGQNEKHYGYSGYQCK